MRLCSVKNNKFVESISAEAMQVLLNHSWPGNIRELENTIERAVIFSKGKVLQRADLPDLAELHELAEMKVSKSETGSAADFLRIPLGTPLESIEKQVIEETLKRTGGDKTKTAEILVIAARTIYRKLDS